MREQLCNTCSHWEIKNIFFFAMEINNLFAPCEREKSYFFIRSADNSLLTKSSSRFPLLTVHSLCLFCPSHLSYPTMAHTTKVALKRCTSSRILLEKSCSAASFCCCCCYHHHLIISSHFQSESLFNAGQHSYACGASMCPRTFYLNRTHRQQKPQSKKGCKCEHSASYFLIGFHFVLCSQ